MTLRAQLEDPNNDSSFCRVDPEDPLTLRAGIVVAIRLSAGHKAGSRLAERRINGTLTGLLAFDFSREVHRGEHELILSTLQRHLASFEVAVDLDACFRELLERVAGLELLATDA